MEQKTILVVDDEERMRKIVRDFLSVKGYQIEEAGDGVEALEKFAQKDIDLVILDVMMPRMDGLETCLHLRKESNVPIIMLTARSEESDELVGFDMGADEYITKPFSPRILVARVEAILRRTGEDDVQVRTFGCLTINHPAREVRVNHAVCELTYKEFELLTYLSENSGLALSREQILNRVWDYGYYGDERTVDTHIKTLRSKIREAGEYIHTVRGVGYKFEVVG